MCIKIRSGAQTGLYAKTTRVGRGAGRNAFRVLSSVFCPPVSVLRPNWLRQEGGRTLWWHQHPLIQRPLPTARLRKPRSQRPTNTELMRTPLHQCLLHIVKGLQAAAPRSRWKLSVVRACPRYKCDTFCTSLYVVPFSSEGCHRSRINECLAMHHVLADSPNRTRC
jgi:hypothetical protein